MNAPASLPCSCGHEFSTSGMFHIGDCPRKQLPMITGPVEYVDEPLLLRIEDGPDAGTRLVSGWLWPLPEMIAGSGGVIYVKTLESQLDAQPAGSHVIRGATYRQRAQIDTEAAA